MTSDQADQAIDEAEVHSEQTRVLSSGRCVLRSDKDLAFDEACVSDQTDKAFDKSSLLRQVCPQVRDRDEALDLTSVRQDEGVSRAHELPLQPAMNTSDLRCRRWNGHLLVPPG